VTDLNSRYREVKRRAKKKKLILELTKEKYFEITSQKCYYCGQHSHGRDYTGIDRIDSNKGYTKKNSVPCCERCNYAKNVMGKEEFRNHIKKVFYNWARKGE
jgi:hypothetical protein